MSDQKKRKRVASVEGQSENNVPRKSPKPTVDEIEPVQPPSRPPDTSSLFKRITSASKQASTQVSVHQGYRYSVGIAEPFQKITQPWSAQSDANLVRPGHLSSDDYLDGYISDEGNTFLKAIHTHKDGQLESAVNLKGGKTSRSGNDIKTGNETSATYHGVNIKYRVDFTEVEDKLPDEKKSRKKGPKKAEDQPEPQRSTHLEPHARIQAFGRNASTVELAEFANALDTHGTATEKQHFLEGVKGQAPSVPQISDAFAAGVEARAVARGSDAFGQVFPAFEGLLLSKPQTPQDVRNLFFHPDFQTGALGHQNNGIGATTDFNSFKEIVGNARVEHTANVGTDIEKVSRIRKARAINALVPTDTPIVDITIRPKTK